MQMITSPIYFNLFSGLDSYDFDFFHDHLSIGETPASFVKVFQIK